MRSRTSPFGEASAQGKAKPVQVTVDLDPADYDLLRDWAHDARMSHSDVLRALIHVLSRDTRVSQQVRKSVGYDEYETRRTNGD